MKVRGIMIVVIHGNNDAQESTDFRQDISPRLFSLPIWLLVNTFILITIISMG
jgi:hypothetical protein